MLKEQKLIKDIPKPSSSSSSGKKRGRDQVAADDEEIDEFDGVPASNYDEEEEDEPTPVITKKARKTEASPSSSSSAAAKPTKKLTPLQLLAQRGGISSEDNDLQDLEPNEDDDALTADEKEAHYYDKLLGADTDAGRAKLAQEFEEDGFEDFWSMSTLLIFCCPLYDSQHLIIICSLTIGYLNETQKSLKSYVKEKKAKGEIKDDDDTPSVSTSSSSSSSGSGKRQFLKLKPKTTTPTATTSTTATKSSNPSGWSGEDEYRKAGLVEDSEEEIELDNASEPDDDDDNNDTLTTTAGDDNDDDDDNVPVAPKKSNLKGSASRSSSNGVTFANDDDEDEDDAVEGDLPLDNDTDNTSAIPTSDDEDDDIKESKVETTPSVRPKFDLYGRDAPTPTSAVFNSVYRPPAVRAAEAAAAAAAAAKNGNTNAADEIRLAGLKKTINSLLNKLTHANVEGIVGEIKTLYSTNSKRGTSHCCYHYLHSHRPVLTDCCMAHRCNGSVMQQVTRLM
jgi:hypothetical protein